jgi:probable dihydroxyacetone kinase regulator
MAGNHMKYHIANTFKQLTKSKSLTKITIQDITEACQINRSTFYYHFEDKDALILWIFKNDISDKFIEPKNKIWTQNTYHLLQTFQRDLSFYMQAIKIDSVNSLRKCLYKLNYAASLSVIEEILNGRKLSVQSKNFLASFYAHALTETNIDYIKQGAKESPEKMLQHYYITADPCIASMVESLLEHDNDSGMLPFEDTEKVPWIPGCDL